MSDITRRSFLASTPATAIFVAAPAAAISAALSDSAASTDVRTLIAVHRAAAAELDAAIDVLDAEPKRTATVAQNKRWSRAVNAEVRAINALCAHAPPDETSRRMKGRYLLAYHRSTGLEPDQTEALVRSLLGGGRAA